MVEAVSGVGQSLASPQKIDLKIWVQPDLPLIYADPMRIKLVLYNLLSNAIKFTPAGGMVTLRASRSADGVTISVEEYPGCFENSKSWSRRMASRGKEPGSD